MDSKQDRLFGTDRDSNEAGANPYTATTVVPSPLHTAVFSRSYWIVIWIVFLASLAFFTLAFFTFHWSLALGVLFLLTSVFALGRSFATTLRIRAYKMSETANRLQEHEISFLLVSLLLGGIASVASCIAFFAICIPAGAVLFEFQGPRGNFNSDQVIVSLSIACGVIGFLLGGFFIYLTLPSVRREMRMAEKESSLPFAPRK